MVLSSTFNTAEAVHWDHAKWPVYGDWWCTRIVLYWLRVTCQIRWLLAQVPLYVSVPRSQASWCLATHP